MKKGINNYSTDTVNKIKIIAIIDETLHDFRSDNTNKDHLIKITPFQQQKDRHIEHYEFTQ